MWHFKSKFGIITLSLTFLFHIIPLFSYSQLLEEKNKYSKYDSLLGSLNQYRQYDALHYDIHLQVSFDSQSISGHTTMKFKPLKPLDTIQIDLFSIYPVDKIMLGTVVLKYYRDSNFIFVIMPHRLSTKQQYVVSTYYHGTPIKAKRAPWDGGFVWKKDSNQGHWVGVACEGLGASSWWPCKDHWSDEPQEGVTTHFTVPIEYKAISNGLLQRIDTNSTTTTWHWRIVNPINLYGVTLDIAKYVEISSHYISKIDNKKLPIHFWVLKQDEEKARIQFKQVFTMLDCFEEKMGPYPFYEDGYQLIETPFLGMEHQSAVAYGNGFENGYRGNLKMTGGIPFDYIIIHESGHEWFGNNVSASDNADMWIHEAYTNYSESLYAECLRGEQAGLDYINYVKKRIQNKHPAQGPYGVAKEGSGDMYAKGAVFLNTLRFQIDNDKLWYQSIKDIQKELGKKTSSYQDIINFYTQKTKKDYSTLFSQYLQDTFIPMATTSKSIGKNGDTIITLQLKGTKPDFSMWIFYTIDHKLSKIKLGQYSQKIQVAKGKSWALDRQRMYIRTPEDKDED